jgi:hypothetical protein
MKLEAKKKPCRIMTFVRNFQLRWVPKEDPNRMIWLQQSEKPFIAGNGQCFSKDILRWNYC